MCINSCKNQHMYTYDLHILSFYDIEIHIYIHIIYITDVVLEEIKEALGSLSDEDIDNYYRLEFKSLSNNQELISYNQLLNWNDIKMSLDNNVITLEQFELMWNALPKRPMNNENNNEKITQIDGISLDAFMNFNTALEQYDSDLSSSALY
jgi:hypothetical protein